MIIRRNKSKINIEGKVISGESGNYLVSIDCPHCGETHRHDCVEAGDVRFCAKGKGNYRIVFPGERVHAFGFLDRRRLSVVCPLCGKKHIHGNLDIRVGDTVFLVAHCLLGSYHVQVIEGGKQ